MLCRPWRVLVLLFLFPVLPIPGAAGASTWSVLAPAARDPTPREDHAMSIDRARRQVLVFGGYDDSGVDFLDETWAYRLGRPGGWQEVIPAGETPPGRLKPGMDFDPLYDRLVVFGGSGIGETDYDDLWFLSFSPTPAWRQVVPPGERPAGRWGGSFVYDSRARRMLLFGGKTVDGDLDDLWQLTLAQAPAWERLAPADPKPTGRSLQATAYDSLGMQMIVFGGHDGAYKNDVWVLRQDPKPRWLQLQPAGTSPAPRIGATLVVDGAGRRAILFGGWDGTRILNDTWELKLGPQPAWTQLHPGGVAPSPRVDHAAVFDPATRRMLTFGGFDQAAHRFGEVWQLVVSEEVAAAAATKAAAAGQPAATKPAASARVATPKAAIPKVPAGKVAAAPAAPAPKPSSAAAGALVLSVKTPSRGKLDVSWSLPRDEVARLEMFDPAGNRQWSHNVDRSGRYSVPNADRIKSGPYFVRITQGRESRVVQIDWKGR